MMLSLVSDRPKLYLLNLFHRSDQVSTKIYLRSCHKPIIKTIYDFINERYVEFFMNKITFNCLSFEADTKHGVSC